MLNEWMVAMPTVPCLPTLSSKVVLIKLETIQRGQSVFLYEPVIMFFSVVNIFTWQSMRTDSFEDSLKWPLEELQFWLYFFSPEFVV